MNNITPKKLKNIIITFAVFIVLIVAGFNTLTGSHKSEPSTTVSQSAPSLTTDATITPLPVSPSTGNSDIMSKLNSLTIANASGVKYDRGEWHHWNDLTPCWNVRDEVLYRDAVQDGTLTLLDKNKVRTSDKAKACYVAGGTWNDPYTGTVFTNPEDLDIDHMIPLNYAAQHGGQAWDSGKKESYANNMDYAHHLIAVSASANRSKSDKGPGEWKPANTSDYCTYATDWVNISSTWGLSVAQSDKDALSGMLATCK